MLNMALSERLHKLAKPIGHEWTPLAGLRVCIHCGCDHDTPDALEKCVPEAQSNAVSDYHLHELKSAIDRCMADGVCEYEIVSAVAEAMAGKGKK